MNGYLKTRLIGCGVVVAILAVVGIGVAIYQGIIAAKHAQFAGPFKPQMAAYLAPAQNPQDPGPEQTKATGPVKGKMIVLDETAKDFDWEVTDGLPAELKAVKPEEVGTVVLVNWHKDVVGNYEGGGSAYQYTADVTVVDHARRAVIGTNSFLGGEPPHEISGHSSEGTGSKPIKEIVGYLTGLPRQ